MKWHKGKVNADAERREMALLHNAQPEPARQEKREYPTMPAGEHELGCIEAEETTSKSGNRCMKFVFSPTAQEWERKKIWHYIVIGSEYFDESIERMAAAMGIALDEDSEIPQVFIGGVMRAKIMLEEYRGKMSEKIAFMIPAHREEPEEQQQAPQEIADDSIPF